MTWRLPLAAAVVVVVTAAEFLAVGHGSGCDPFGPTSNGQKPLDLAYLKAHSRHLTGSLALGSPQVTGQYQSRDPRNFAVEVSVAEYSIAVGFPTTDAQNPFYGMGPARRVIIVVSYGSFKWVFSGDFAAQPVGPMPYSVGMVAVDARDGTALTSHFPICR